MSSLNLGSSIDPEDVRNDVDLLLWSMQLQFRRRYFHQRFWEQETQAAEYASLIEPFPRLETVAEHSWHVADAIAILAGHFPEIELNRCLLLAILHDKMETITKDISPIGDFSDYREAFKSWVFICMDLERLELEPTDFVYADPPYDVEFTEYSKGGFGWDEQERAAEWLAKHRGPVVLSNQATPRIVRL